MSYGFGAEFGTGAADRIANSKNPSNGLVTYGIRVFHNGPGGGNLGRFFESNDGADSEAFFWNAVSNYISFQRTYSGGIATWSCPLPTNNAVHTYGFSKNFGNTTAPSMYIDGTARTVTVIGAATGTVNTISTGMCVGNRPTDNARGLDGWSDRLYRWDAILTAQEHADFAAGADPESDTGWTSGSAPAGLSIIMPMAVDAVDAAGNTTTVTGALLILEASPDATAPGGTGTSTGSGTGGAASGGGVVPVIEGGYERSSVNLSASSVSGSGDSALISIAPKVQESEVVNSETRWLEPSARIVGVNGFRPTFKFLNYAATATNGTYHGAPWQTTRRTMFSYNQRDWRPFDNCTVGASDITFRHNTAFTSDTVYIGRSRQISVTQMGQWIEGLSADHPTMISPTVTSAAFTPTLTSWPAQAFIADEYSAQIDSLGVTIPPTPLYAFKISDPSLTPAAGGPKRLLVLWGGVHAGEDHGDYALMRTVEHLLGNSAESLSVRAEFDTVVHPLENAPGRVGGGYRGSFTQGVGGIDDLNRHFSDVSPGLEIITKPRTALLADFDGKTPVVAYGFHGMFSDGNFGFYASPTSPLRSNLLAALEAASGFDVIDKGDASAGGMPTWFSAQGALLAVDIEHGDLTPVSDAELITWGGAVVESIKTLIDDGNLFVIAEGGIGTGAGSGSGGDAIGQIAAAATGATGIGTGSGSGGDAVGAVGGSATASGGTGTGIGTGLGGEASGVVHAVAPGGTGTGPGSGAGGHAVGSDGSSVFVRPPRSRIIPVRAENRRVRIS